MYYIGHLCILCTRSWKGAVFVRESDPRVIRTKEHIKQCFFELMKEKPAEEISVKELCEKAHCSRNAFYLHFQYRDNLYKQIVDECIAEILYGFRPLTSRISDQTDAVIDQYTYNFLEGIHNNANVLRIILASDNNGAFQFRFTKKLVDAMVLLSAQTSGFETGHDEWRLICSYNAGAFVGFTFFWLEHPNIPFDRAHKMLRDLMDSSMRMGEKYLPEQTTPR